MSETVLVTGGSGFVAGCRSENDRNADRDRVGRVMAIRMEHPAIHLERRVHQADDDVTHRELSCGLASPCHVRPI